MKAEKEASLVSARPLAAGGANNNRQGTTAPFHLAVRSSSFATGRMTDQSNTFVAPPGTPPLVQLKGIAKYFPGVIANQDVDIEVLPGEIHALLGENGAGKSTLMNILTGIYQPDAGEIIIEGYAREFSSPVQAIAAGIGMVHQHFKLVQAFTVAENIHLGWSETPRRASASVLEARTAELARRFNLDTKPSARVSDLSTGEQQRVEILRVLARKAKVLILDEPTAVLTPAEARELFKACATSSPRAMPSSSSPTSSMKCWKSPTASRSCAAAARWRPRWRRTARLPSLPG